MTEKLTYAQALDSAINAVENAEIKEKLVALKAQIEKKGENRKPRVNAEKLALAEKVVAVMEPGITYRVAELAKMMGVSTQKMTPALGQAVEDGKVEKYVEKRVTMYRIAE